MTQVVLLIRKSGRPLVIPTNRKRAYKSINKYKNKKFSVMSSLSKHLAEALQSNRTSDYSRLALSKVADVFSKFVLYSWLPQSCGEAGERSEPEEDCCNCFHTSILIRINVIIKYQPSIVKRSFFAFDTFPASWGKQVL